jgi:hypothetical protein
VDTRVKDSSLYLDTVLETLAEGPFVSVMRGRGWTGQPLLLGGKTYAHGLGVLTEQRNDAIAEYDLEGGGWKRLRGVIGLEPGYRAAAAKPGLSVRFVVKGDGKELFRSEPFRWDSPPTELNVGVSGVRTLRLEALGDAPWDDSVRSVDWADVRLEK